MKKTNRPAKKPALTLRREHIRLLTPADLEKAVGGDWPTVSDGCNGASKHNIDHCH